VRNLYIGL
jgi:hypothetical protein